MKTYLFQNFITHATNYKDKFSKKISKKFFVVKKLYIQLKKLKT